MELPTDTYGSQGSNRSCNAGSSQETDLIRVGELPFWELSTSLLLHLLPLLIIIPQLLYHAENSLARQARGELLGGCGRYWQ